MYKCYKRGFKEIIHFFSPLCLAHVCHSHCVAAVSPKGSGDGQMALNRTSPKHCQAGDSLALISSACQVRHPSYSPDVLKNSLVKLTEIGMPLASFPYLCQKKDAPSFIKHTESHSFEISQFYGTVLHYKKKIQVCSTNLCFLTKFHVTYLLFQMKSGATIRMQATPNSKSVLCMNHNAVWIVIPWVYWLTAPWSLWVTKH